MPSLVRKFLLLPRRSVMLAVRVYQSTLSPDHGPLRKLRPHGFCRYYPTCSDYGYQAVERYGIIRGIPRILWRIVRCNPWSKGGVDEVK